MGIRAADLTDTELFRKKIANALHEKNALPRALYNDPETIVDDVLEEIRAPAARPTPHLSAIY